MALKFTQKSATGVGSGGTYDHNLLINRGLPDQHTIESITGLRDLLARKYEKPFSGIPKTDLAFEVATLRDIDNLRSTDIQNVINDLTAIANEIQHARGDQTNLRDYIDTKVSYADWSGNGGIGGGHIGSEVGYPLYEEYLALEGQTHFQLTKTYQMGTHQLEVFLNGLRMVLGSDYSETTDSSVDFFFPMEKDDRLLFMVRSVINSGLHEEYIAEKSQTLFKLVSPYGIYQNILQVFRNGVLQRKGKDYREIDNQRIEFTYEMILGDTVTFHQAGATDPIAGTIMESEIGRLKINHAYTTMMLHDVARSLDTDYLDMYVDTFISDANIDKDASLEYQYVSEGIEVGEVRIMVDELHEFLRGITGGTDVVTYPDQARLSNLPGGAEMNTFDAFTSVHTAEPVDDAFFIVNNRKTEFYFASIQRTSGITELVMKTKRFIKNNTPVEYTKVLNTTIGYFFNVQADHDADGTIHISYHEQGGSGKAKVFYAKILNDGTIVFNKRISDSNFDSIGADITVEKDGTAHICYSSKRISDYVFNIEYRYFKDDFESGRIDITALLNFDSINSAIVVGSDGLVRITFETLAFNGMFKNIKFVELDKGTKVFEMYLTTSDLFENVTPDMDIDNNNVCRVVWRSRRLSPNFGVEYASVSPDHTVSSVHTVMAGSTSIICGIPRLRVDYENISHIVFHANEQLSNQNNIMYTYVYESGTVNPVSNIAFRVAESFNDPDISIHGESVSVAFLGANASYRMQKRIVNYNLMGMYIAVLDSRSNDTKWQEIKVEEYLPAGTTSAYQYRLSNDSIIWTSWKSVDDIGTETAGGRVMQIRATLTSDTKHSPEIFSIMARCEPDVIEVISMPKYSDKEVSSTIVVAKFTGDITFEVSRDAGKTFLPAIPERSVNMIATPSGQTVVIKAKIRNGSRLDAWAVVW